jgi:hypothetical protein
MHAVEPVGERGGSDRFTDGTGRFAAQSRLIDEAAYLCFNAFMRTTLDLSDDLFRRAKAEAALRGRKLKDLVEDGLRRVLDQSDSPVVPPPPVSLHDLMQDCCGVAEPTPPDYASNSAHLDGFGR